MTSIPFSLPGNLPAGPTALVIEPVLPHLLAVLSALSSMGFDTTVAETFQDAKSSLAAHRPTLLVTGVKLREFNGLHLVLRATSAWPDLACIVTSDREDPVLQDEAERLGATFIVLPISAADLVAAVARTVLQEVAPGAVPEPVRPPFERRSDRRGVRDEERRRNVADAIRALFR